MNKKKLAMVVVGAVAVVVILVIIIVAVVKKGKGSTNNSATGQNNYNDRLVQIQAKIDAQQEIINKINEEMTPLVEKRSKLEEELMEITTASAEETAEAPEEETSEEESPAEENPSEEAPAEETSED